MSISYNFNISRDLKQHQRVTFGPYHQGKGKNAALGLRILETTTCWQKLGLLIQKYLLNRIVTLQDVNGLIVHVYRYKLNKCIVRYLKKNPKGGYAKYINKICKMAHPSTVSHVTSKDKTASFSKSIESSSATTLTTIIHSSGDEANPNTKILLTKGLYSSSSSEEGNDFSESLQKDPRKQLETSKGSGRRIWSDETSDSSSSESSQKDAMDKLRSSKGSGEYVFSLPPKVGKAAASKINAIAKSHFSNFVSTCFDNDGKVNNEVERRKAVENPWGSQGICPDTLRKKASAIRQNAMFLPEQSEKLIVEANRLENRANELEKDLEDTMRNFQKTFFPCRGDFEDIEEDDFLEDASEKFAESQVVYYGTSSECAERIRNTKIFLKITQRELDSGSGVYFVKEKRHALDIAKNSNDANIITCKISPIKTAYIKNQRALDCLVTHFFQMAQIYTFDNEDLLSEELQEAGIIEGKVERHGKIMSDIQEYLCDKVVRLYFTKMGYDTVYSPSGGRYEDIPYFNVLKHSKKNITILN